jgi:hypothetical protein
MTPENPRRVGPSREIVSLNDKLVPWDVGLEQPILFGMPGSTWLYVAGFPSVSELHAFMMRIGIGEYTIKLIESTDVFLASFTPTQRSQYCIIIDPWFTPEGRIRFSQLDWSSAVEPAS